MQFFNFAVSAAQKWNFPKLISFILTIHNYGISCARYFLNPIHVLFALFGFFDGGKGLGHNPLMQFSTLSGSKMEIFNTDFFDVLTIHNHQIFYVKHILDPLYVLFTLFGCDGGLLNDFVTS